MLLTVGSLPASLLGIARRNPVDLDYWTDDKDLYERFKGKADIKLLPEYIMRSLPTGYHGNTISLTKDALYTIKCSHLGWSNPQWSKHKLDALYMKEKGCEIILPLYHVLVNYWEIELGNKSFLSLDKSKNMFFNDFVDYQYDHDYLHEVVAYPDRPAYEKCLKDGHEVLTDKNKFDKLSFEEQVKMFREEITVIALERWYLNSYWFDRGITWMKAYSLALQKTITNLTKGWATDFIVLNLEYFNVPEREMFDKAISKLNLKEKYMSKYLGSKGVELVKEIYLAGVEQDLNYHSTSHEDDSEDYWSDILVNFLEYNIVDGWNLPEDCCLVQQEGGGEGGAEDCFAVFSWKDKYYRVNYNYYSYHGYDNLDMESIYEVFPKEKVVTVFE